MYDQSYTGTIIRAHTTIADQPLSWRISKCIIVGIPMDSAIYCIHEGINTSALDVDFIVENCFFLTMFPTSHISFLGALGTYRSGGGIVTGCTFITTAKVCDAVTWSTAMPVSFTNNVTITPDNYYALQASE